MYIWDHDHTHLSQDLLAVDGVGFHFFLGSAIRYILFGQQDLREGVHGALDGHAVHPRDLVQLAMHELAPVF